MKRRHPGRWYEETVYPHARQSLEITRLIFEQQTEHQHIIVFENPHFGRVLAIDGVVQISERDEFVYQEMMAHVPILSHGRVKNVLIIGGGDGAVARECLRHPGLKVTLAEIDRTVIDVVSKHIPAICGGAFDNPRLDLVIMDGCRYVRESAALFDVVIIDSSDPIGPSAALFTEEFLTDCTRLLTGDGILVNLNSVCFFEPRVARDTLAIFSKLLPDVSCFVAAVPSYYGGFIPLGWGAKSLNPRQRSLEDIRKDYRSIGLTTKYYNPDMHKASFVLPGYIHELLPKENGNETRLTA